MPMAAFEAPGPRVFADDYLEEVFERLAFNKQFPKYQAERAVMPLLVPFLPELLERLLEWTLPIECTAMEFPIKADSNYQSTNADALLFKRAASAKDERWILFELKTDNRSSNQQQLERYAYAVTRGMPALVQDLAGIGEKSGLPGKYFRLQNAVRAFPENRPIEIVYLAPKPLTGTPPELDGHLLLVRRDCQA